MKAKLSNYLPKAKLSKDKKNITNQELLEELRTRIIAGTIEVEWEDTYGDSSTITDIVAKSGKKWVRLNFEEVLIEHKKQQKLKKP